MTEDRRAGDGWIALDTSDLDVATTATELLRRAGWD
jgi:hypothetical protein